MEQAAAAVLVADGASCSRSCQRITTAWVGAAAELASVRQWLALCAHVGHVRWWCCVCCRVVTADWLCVCVWWEVRCVYVVIAYDCVFVWWVVCCVLCVRVVIGFTFLFQTIFFFKFCVAQSEFWIGSGWINSWLRGSSASQTRIFSDRIRLFATPTKYGLSTTSN